MGIVKPTMNNYFQTNISLLFNKSWVEEKTESKEINTIGYHQPCFYLTSYMKYILSERSFIEDDSKMYWVKLKKLLSTFMDRGQSNFINMEKRSL